MNSRNRTWAIGVTLLASMSMSMAGAYAQSFAGRSIDMVVGYAPGGGHDAYARLIASHLPRFLDGRPNVIVQNMPGAASALAAEFVFRSPVSDGTLIGVVGPGAIVYPALTGEHAGRYDPQELVYLGTANLSTFICVTYGPDTPQDFEEVRERGLVLGTSAPGGSTYDYSHILRNVVGDQVRVISGYPGTRDLNIAMETGEIDGVCGMDWATAKTTLPNELASGAISVFVQFAVESEPELDAMGVPDMRDLVEEEDRAALELLVSQQVFGRTYALPPATDPEIAATLRAAFDRTLADPGFLAEAAALNLDILAAGGDALQEVIETIYAAAPETLARARELMSGD